MTSQGKSEMNSSFILGEEKNNLVKTEGERRGGQEGRKALNKCALHSDLGGLTVYKVRHKSPHKLSE